MPIVVGISLRTAGKIYFFNPAEERYFIGERLLVETARGEEIGTVKLPPHEVSEAEVVPPLKDIIRRATVADLARDYANREREERAIIACNRYVAQLNLPMRLIDAQYTLDGTHLLIHFLSDNRVDFRELVRNLAHELHVRIELRQVGVRDEAKLIGGYGICGRQLCCSAFLNDFAPVGISMAKEQGLALNPQKISGSCGRLMCCLAFECKQYRVDRAELPCINSQVNTPQGPGKVVKLNVLSHDVEVFLPESSSLVWFNLDELEQVGNEVEGEEVSCGGCCAKARNMTNDSDTSIVTPAASSSKCEQPPTFSTVTSTENNIVKSEGGRSRRRRRGGAKTATPAKPDEKVHEASAVEGNNTRRPRRRRPSVGRNDSNINSTNAAGSIPTTGSVPVDGQTRASHNRNRPRRRKKTGQNEGG